MNRCRAILIKLFNSGDLYLLKVLTLSATEGDTSNSVSEFEISKWKLKIKFVASFIVYMTVKLNAGRILSPLPLPKISLSFHLEFVHLRRS